MRGHCFVNGVEKHIYCAYVGIDGKAQYIMKPTGIIKYGGSIENLSVPRQNLSATAIDNYILFGGGIWSITAYSTVDAYDSSLIRTTATDLSVARSQLAAITINNHALFAGGFVSNSTYTSTVDAYDNSLTRTTVSSLSQGRRWLVATTVGNYALFGGGSARSSPTVSSTVDAYNSSLTRTTVTRLSVARYDLEAGTIGNYALFAGGFAFINKKNIYYSTVDAYNSSLTKTTATDLSVTRRTFASTTIGGHVLFGSGWIGNTMTPTVDAYDTSLTRSSAPDAEEFNGPVAFTLHNYALFCYLSGFNHPNPVMYDSFLTKSRVPAVLSARMCDFGYSVFKNYALFGGGYLAGGKKNSTVEAYTYNDDDGYIP